MPTDDHDDTDERLRERFQMLGRHLRQALDDPRSPSARPTRPSSPHTRRRPVLYVAAVAAMLLIGGTLVWMSARHGGPADAPAIVSVFGDDPDTPGPAVSTDGTAVWPPPVEVHEHCVEDAETRAIYADADYPSEELRAQHCERSHHDHLARVHTPDDVGPGAASSAALADPTASDEFHEALTTQGMNGNDFETQRRTAGLWRAFQTRHAVPVLDPNGRQIGWFGAGFVSSENLPAAQQEAEKVIDTFERTGDLPPP